MSLLYWALGALYKENNDKIGALLLCRPFCLVIFQVKFFRHSKMALFVLTDHNLASAATWWSWTKNNDTVSCRLKNEKLLHIFLREGGKMASVVRPAQPHQHRRHLLTPQSRLDFHPGNSPMPENTPEVAVEDQGHWKARRYRAGFLEQAFFRRFSGGWRVLDLLTYFVHGPLAKENCSCFLLLISQFALLANNSNKS